MSQTNLTELTDSEGLRALGLVDFKVGKFNPLKMRNVARNIDRYTSTAEDGECPADTVYTLLTDDNGVPDTDLSVVYDDELLWDDGNGNWYDKDGNSVYLSEESDPDTCLPVIVDATTSTSVWRENQFLTSSLDLDNLADSTFGYFKWESQSLGDPTRTEATITRTNCYVDNSLINTQQSVIEFLDDVNGVPYIPVVGSNFALGRKTGSPYEYYRLNIGGFNTPISLLPAEFDAGGSVHTAVLASNGDVIANMDGSVNRYLIRLSGATVTGTYDLSNLGLAGDSNIYNLATDPVTGNTILIARSSSPARLNFYNLNTDLSPEYSSPYYWNLLFSNYGVVINNGFISIVEIRLDTGKGTMYTFPRITDWSGGQLIQTECNSLSVGGLAPGGSGGIGVIPLGKRHVLIIRSSSNVFSPGVFKGLD